MRQILSLWSQLAVLMRRGATGLRDYWQNGGIHRGLGIALCLVSVGLFLFSSAGWAAGGADAPLTTGSVANLVGIFLSGATAVYAFAFLRANVGEIERRIGRLDGGGDPERGLPVRLARIEENMAEVLRRLPQPGNHYGEG